MDPNWKNWCRLCAQEDTTKTNINIKLKDEIESTFLDAISKHFLIDITLKDWPETVCTRCYQYVTDLINFIERTSKVQRMFAELFTKNQEEDFDMKQLRTKYELHELGDVKLMINNDPKPNIEEFEFIDEDMLAIPEIKTEHIDEEEDDDDDEDSIASDKDWRPDNENSSENKGAVKTKRVKDEDDGVDNDDGDDSEEGQNKNKKPKKQPKRFTCTKCKNQYCSYANYSRHTQKEHGIAAEPLPFVCLKCKKSFHTEKACQKHEKTHETAQQKITICPYCNEEFHKNQLRKHIRESHVGAKPFICEECGKAYTSFGNLKEHKLSHSDEMPFQCRVCEKRFKNKSLLRVHSDTHNDTNYICSICGLKLNTRRTLNEHMIVHSDQKEHKCEYCGKEYKRAKNLKIHLIMHTGLKSYYCTFCEKSFTCNANCRLHMKKIHPIELAEKEAGGNKLSNANIPKFGDLRAVISKKAADPMVPVDFKSNNVSIAAINDGGLNSMNDALKSMRAENQVMDFTSKLGIVSTLNDALKTMRAENHALEFKSQHSGILSMNNDMKSLRGKEQQAAMMATPSPQNQEESISQNHQQNSYFPHNRIGYNQLHAS